MILQRCAHPRPCYDDGKCHYKGECGHKAPLTNADRIRAISYEELAEFLSSIAYGRETPWSEPFAEKFCKSCPPTTFTCEAYHHPMELHECDFSDGKCPHGSDIVWWLQQPAEDSANG